MANSSNNVIRVLDFGRVELIGVYPEQQTEAAITRAARTSYANDRREFDPVRDSGLIRFMFEHQHMSPFEMVTVSFLLVVPLSIATQVLRHRTGSFNAMSHRYTPPDRVFDQSDREEALASGQTLKPWFQPVRCEEDVRLQSKTSHQASSEETNTNSSLTELFLRLEHLAEETAETANQLLELGAAREQVRFYYPCGTYTRLVCQFNLRNLLHFLQLRMAPDAQPEIQAYAQAMYLLSKPYFPTVAQIFEEVSLGSCTLTAWELEAITSRKVPASWSKRRQKEFREKMAKLALAPDDFQWDFDAEQLASSSSVKSN